MRLSVNSFVSLLILLGARALAAPLSLEVQVDHVQSERGPVIVSLYKSSDDWLKKGKAVQVQKLMPSRDQLSVQFQLDPGSYAVHVYQDSNSNDKLDMRWLPPGPAEPWVVSNDAQGTMGPPSFKDAQFDLQKPMQLSLSLQKP